jgi:molybdopterin-guanine dinucleotide biosynthesis protein
MKRVFLAFWLLATASAALAQGTGTAEAFQKRLESDRQVLDTAKKDTWRFTKAGSEFSAINSLDHLAIYRRMNEFLTRGISPITCYGISISS